MESNDKDVTLQLAVHIAEACKSYNNRTVVLNGFNMMVPKGSIYGLLGPSGCGKTTLLSCIVGRCKLDAGEIKLLVTERKHIGYMPQELALYNEFSMQETFNYFGKLFGMSKDEIRQKAVTLQKFLDLPSLTNQFGNLSGGQQRRLSLAVALLHNPQLLILDEPTVGMDPILSTSIWEHLYSLSKAGKTIIITTHYIEEAKGADYIGLMREGILLAEDSPGNLMEKYNCSSLENVFLELCLRQDHKDKKPSPRLSTFQSLMTKREKSASVPFKSNEMCNAARANAQLLKQCYWMQRNIRVVLFMLFLPVAVLIIFNYAIGHPPRNIPVAVINHELKWSFHKCAEMSVTRCSNQSLSCQFIRHFRDHNVRLIEYTNVIDATLAVKKNKVWAFLQFPSNYTQSLIQRIELGKEILPELETNSNIHILMDTTDFITSSSLYRDIRESYAEFIEDYFRSCNLSSKLLATPVVFEKPIYGERRFNFTHYSMPAILIIAMFYLPFAFTSSAMVMEKKQGLLERSLVSGVTVIEVLLSHLAVQVVMSLLQLVMMIILQFNVFGYPNKSSLYLPSFLLFLQALNGTFFGLAAGFLCDTELIITLLGIGSTVPQFFISGMLWPVEGMHPMLRTFSIFFPTTLSVEALRVMLVKSWDLTHPPVLRGFVSTVSWIIFFLLLSFIGLKFKNGLRPKK